MLESTAHNWQIAVTDWFILPSQTYKQFTSTHVFSLLLKGKTIFLSFVIFLMMSNISYTNIYILIWWNITL